MNQFLHYARKLALGAAAGVLLSGCFENDFLTEYDGPLQVEFEQVSGQYAQSSPDSSGTIGLTVNLIGPQQPTDVTVQVVVDAASTTAGDGVHYRFPDGAQVTIPAGQSTGTFRIQTIDGALAGPVRNAAGAIVTPAETRTLDLELSGTADGTITGADNLDDFTLTIVGT